MYLPILRELERLLAEVSKVDPSDETKAAETVRAMAARLRGLDTRLTQRTASPAAARQRPMARRA